jgi:hypothetical protein
VTFKAGATATELLQLQKVLRTGLAGAVNHKVAVAPVCGPSVVMVGGADLDAMPVALATICGVSGADTKVEACVVEGVQAKAFVGKEATFVVKAVGYDGNQNLRTEGGDAVEVVSEPPPVEGGDAAADVGEQSSKRHKTGQTPKKTMAADMVPVRQGNAAAWVKKSEIKAKQRVLERENLRVNLIRNKNN